MSCFCTDRYDRYTYSFQNLQEIYISLHLPSMCTFFVLLLVVCDIPCHSIQYVLYLIVICSGCTTSHLLLIVYFLMSSSMHACTSSELFWACPCCSMQGGSNAFLLCAFGGHLAVAEYLAPRMKGHLFDSDYAGYTALHWAAQAGQLSMVEYLVRSCGFDVKAIDKVCLHCLLLVWCILRPLWAHLYLICVNFFFVY